MQKLGVFRQGSSDTITFDGQLGKKCFNISNNKFWPEKDRKENKAKSGKTSFQGFFKIIESIDLSHKMWIYLKNIKR